MSQRRRERTPRDPVTGRPVTAGAVRLVVLDFDGTLADSFGWFCSVLNEVADRHRFRRVEAGEAEALRALGAREIVRLLGIPRWRLPLIARHMHRLAARDAGDLRLFPGVEAMLADLGSAAVPVAILSSNREDTVRRVLGPACADRVDAYACGVSVFGKARRLRRLIARAGVPAPTVLCVGDEIRDLEAARAVGCAFGAVSWGYTHARALAAHAPDHLFGEPAEIVAAIA